MPGKVMSRSSTVQVTVAPTVRRVPASACSPLVSRRTSWLVQCNPLDSKEVVAVALAMRWAEETSRAKEAARAVSKATALMAWLAIAILPPITMIKMISKVTGTTIAASSVVEPRSLLRGFILR